MKKQILLFFLIIANIGFSENIPYVQLVFPKDIHKFPLLFVSELEGEDNIYNPFIKKFILKQAKTRNINHKLILAKDLNNYAINEYKYQITPVYLNLTTFSSEYGTHYSKIVSFIIIDRETGKQYRPFASVRPISKSSYNAAYPNDQLKPVKTNDYFKKLEKIINGFENKGSSKTFKKELKKQRRNGTRMIIPMIVVFTVSGPITAILIG
jgi:hypothetical protein